MKAVREKHPIRFATLLGGAIGAAIGLSFGATEVWFFYWLARGNRARPVALHGDFYVRLIVIPTVVFCLLGALAGGVASSNVFGKRGSVLFTGFLVGGTLSIVMGLGLLPL